MAIPWCCTAFVLLRSTLGTHPNVQFACVLTTVLRQYKQRNCCRGSCQRHTTNSNMSTCLWGFQWDGTQTCSLCVFDLSANRTAATCVYLAGWRVCKAMKSHHTSVATCHGHAHLLRSDRTCSACFNRLAVHLPAPLSSLRPPPLPVPAGDQGVAQHCAAA